MKFSRFRLRTLFIFTAMVDVTLGTARFWAVYAHPITVAPQFGRYGVCVESPFVEILEVQSDGAAMIHTHENVINKVWFDDCCTIGVRTIFGWSWFDIGRTTSGNAIVFRRWTDPRGEQ